jgi:hypothetical protein
MADTRILRAGTTDPEATIQMGDTVIVTFEGATPTPPITGIIRFFDATTASLSVELADTTLYVIKNYAHFAKNLIPPPPLVTIDVAPGDLVTVAFDQSPVLEKTGTVVAIDNANSLIEINDGFNDIVCKDFWYIIRL